jgi:putative transposase
VNRKLKAVDVIDVLSDLFILRCVPSHIRSDNVLCREAALDVGQQVSSRRQGADVGSKLIQMVSTVNGIAPNHSKHRIQRH